MKYLLYTSLFCWSILLVISCRDESSALGSKWVETSFTNIYTDTCTVTLSTILLDSMATSGDTITQIGYYKDSLRGEIICSFYTEYDLVNFSFSESLEYSFDSITITLHPSGNYLGDTLSSPQTMYIHKLTNVLDIEKDYLYNISSASYDPEPYHSFSFTYYPVLKEKIEVRLPDEMGEEFFRLMRYNDMAFSSQEEFRDYFNGFAFLSDTAQECINGFLVNDSSFSINIYYQQLEATVINRVVSFSPSASYHFTKIVHDRSNTPFESLKSNTSNAMPSEETSNMAYLQALSGIYVNLEFPYLNELRRQGEIVSIESASLYLYPVENTYTSQSPLPNSLTLYTTNDEYVVEDVVTDALGSDVQTGKLTIDTMYEKETYYSFDITSFLQSILGTSGNSRKKLMLMLPDDNFMATVESAFFGDKDHPDTRIQLYVLYKTYNNKQ